MSTCALLANLKKLNTKDRISRCNYKINQLCVLRYNQNEDKDHLFFTCYYSKQVLEGIMKKLNISIGNDRKLKQILEIDCQNQHDNPIFKHLKNIAFNSLIWNIWCERNSRAFRGIVMPTQVRVILIIQDWKSLILRKLNNGKLSFDLVRILAGFDTEMDLRLEL